MQINESDLFQYISDFYQTVDTKLNLLSQAMVAMKNHITRLYALEHNAYDIPPATGHLKLKQDACLQLLRMVDKTLRDAGIQYFLGYGNLLGAARTGGFIAWDDDADICLMRDDFDRAVQVLTEKFNHGHFFTTWGASGGIFKVLMTNRICVDLFPWDYYFKPIDTDEDRAEFYTRYRTAMAAARPIEDDKHARETNPAAPKTAQYDNYVQIRDEIILRGEKQDTTHGAIFEGIDWQTFPERYANFYHDKPFRHEWIFPLGEIEFCGHKFMAPNNVDAWLTTRFGDWSEFRPDFTRHSNTAFSYEELEIVRDFIKMEL